MLEPVSYVSKMLTSFYYISLATLLTVYQAIAKINLSS